MDRFEQDEMRNLVFSKYAATFTKFLKAAKSDTVTNKLIFYSFIHHFILQ